jgi:cytochrome c oxidase assembly protein subunit 15
MENLSVDWPALLRLALVGLLLVAGPLAWVLWRQRKAKPVGRMQALTLLTLFLTFDLVLFGAFTRLTDSGLGCPDWPGCYGHATPLGAQVPITLAQAASPDGPVTHGKAWIEMVHRYLASGVGLLILVLALNAWMLVWRRRSGPTDSLLSPWWATATLVWVCIQGAFGALTVTMKLFPAIVSLHLLGGYVLLGLLALQAVRQSQMLRAQKALPVAAGVRLATLVAMGVLLVQVLSGAWVSTNYAVLACAEFPTCQGSWWPEMDFAQGFALWRPLGLAADGTPLSFQALTAIHFSHRMLALVAVLVLGLLAWRLRRLPSLAAPVRCLIALLVLQVVTGLSNVVLGWPLLAAVLHTGGAGAMAATLVWILAATRNHARLRSAQLGTEKAMT